MKDIVSKALKEIARILAAALLAALGIDASGCISNNGSASAFIVTQEISK